MAISRLFRKFKILQYLGAILFLFSLLKLYPSIKNRLIGQGLDANRTYMLTVNHDSGRLGNKMFKYASLLGIAKREGRKPFVLPYTQDVDMESVFNLTFVAHHTQFNIGSWEEIEETEYAYEDPIFRNLPKTDIKLWGYLQSWKYFHSIEHVLRREFTFTPVYKSEADGILNDIREKHQNKDQIVFVGVHVRRRDEHSTKITCEAPKSFFTNAFQKMRSLLPGKTLIFIVSGNDLSWCERNLANNDTVVLQPSSSAFHFAILASCDHFVVSVGTFGWWAGWLTGGHVIYYKKFPLPLSYEAIGFHIDDYYPASWISVDD
ncbi:unnamed protein product [Candidula unifasciata]|uniref:L-Fucosyltransferase n=1 Tax=Candidula unifasciata TaxID=100452 RepID=A0A8S3YU27_9EUPU|nr:unnamed protein product [Candidula unifasciata]